jgi:hypothetical protein
LSHSLLLCFGRLKKKSLFPSVNYDYHAEI